jgi:hypothetical protein
MESLQLFRRVADLEQEIASLTDGDSIDGLVARLGAVAACVKARQPRRALELATVYRPELGKRASSLDEHIAAADELVLYEATKRRSVWSRGTRSGTQGRWFRALRPDRRSRHLAVIRRQDTGRAARHDLGPARYGVASKPETLRHVHMPLGAERIHRAASRSGKEVTDPYALKLLCVFAVLFIATLAAAFHERAKRRCQGNAARERTHPRRRAPT